MLTATDIIEIFSYTDEEQEAFDYLKKYMNAVRPRFKEIQSDDAMLKRFALAGLFLAYRASNYMGETMSTEVTADSKGIGNRRLRMFHDYFKTEIKSSSHYLKLINLNVFDFICFILWLKRPAAFLRRLVLGSWF